MCHCHCHSVFTVLALIRTRVLGPKSQGPSSSSSFPSGLSTASTGGAGPTDRSTHRRERVHLATPVRTHLATSGWVGGEGGEGGEGRGRGEGI